jgi:hypothetical protein
MLSSALMTAGTQPGRRASDSQMPPPINTAPEMQPNNLLCRGFMNQARPNPAANAQPESSTAPKTTEHTHITKS